MCIIVYRPEHKTIAKAFLKNCFDNNDDGWGIMYPQDGKLVTVKGLDSFDEFYAAYRAVPAGVHCGMHFRIKTHGLISLENCHPYPILEQELDGQDMALMHNGIISAYKTTDHTRSDTWHYVQQTLRPIFAGNSALVHDAEMQDLIGGDIGWSKLLIMDGDGNAVIINEKKGVWDYGCWWSNTSFEKPPYVAPYRYTPAKTYETDKPYNWRDYYEPYNNKTTNEALELECIDCEPEPSANENAVRGILGLPKPPLVYDGGTVSKPRVQTVGELNHAWEAELDRREAEKAAREGGDFVGGETDLSDDSDDYTLIDDPDQMSESELFNWVVENPEAATDYIMELGGGRLVH